MIAWEKVVARPYLKNMLDVVVYACVSATQKTEVGGL
jgi:hypothetical protein